MDTIPTAEAAPAASDPAAAADAQLLRRYVEARDEDAFAALVARYADLVYAACRRRLNDPAGADDAAQAVFVVLERRAPSLARGWARPPLAAWLLRAARLTCANAERRRRRRERHERAAGAIAPAARAIDLERLRRIEDELARLPRACRDAVTLRYLVGRSREQIAAELGIAVESVKKRLTRGLALLRARLGEGEEATAASLAALVIAGPVAPRPPTPSPEILRLAQETLMSLRLPLIATGTAVALVAGGALAAAAFAADPHPAAADATPPAVAPAQTVPYALTAGETLYAEVVSVWQLEPPAGTTIPDGLPIAERAVEYVVYRVEVRAAADGAAQVVTTPAFAAMAVPTRGGMVVDDAVVLDGPDRIYRRVDFVGEPGQAGFALPLAIPATYRADGSLRSQPDEIRDSNQVTYETAVVDLGIPAWLPPLPAARPAGAAAVAVSMDVGGAPAGGSATTTADGLREDFPALVLSERQVFDYTLSLGGFAQQVVVSAAATGTGRIELAWPAAARLPERCGSTWRFDVTLLPRFAGGGGLPPLKARLTLLREARPITLAAPAAGEGADDAASLARRILAARGQALADLVRDPTKRLPKDAPAWAVGLARGAGFAGLNRLVHPEGRPLNVRAEVPADAVPADAAPVEGGGAF